MTPRAFSDAVLATKAAWPVLLLMIIQAILTPDSFPSTLTTHHKGICPSIMYLQDGSPDSMHNMLPQPVILGPWPVRANHGSHAQFLKYRSQFHCYFCFFHFEYKK